MPRPSRATRTPHRPPPRARRPLPLLSSRSNPHFPRARASRARASSPDVELLDSDDAFSPSPLGEPFVTIPYSYSWGHPLPISPTPVSPASSSAATIPPPSPRRPTLVPGLAVPPALNVPRLPALLDAVAERSAELVRLRRALQVESQRLLAARAAAGCAGGKSGGGGEDEGRGEDCPICLERLLAPTAVLARCGHMFHRHCIEQHLAQRRLSGCPICRQNMHRAELVQVMSGIPETGESEGGRGVHVGQQGKGKKEAVVVCLDDDGEEVIDLVDSPGSGEKGDGSSSGGASGVVDGTGDLRGLSRALEGALGAVERELMSSKVVPETVALVEKERDLLQTRWKTELTNVKKVQEATMSDLRKEKRAARAEVADLRHRSEEVRQKEAEINDELSTAKKLRNDLDIKKKELDVREEELELDRAKVNDEQLECLREKKRYEALVTARQRKEKAKELPQRDVDRLSEMVPRKKRKLLEDADSSDEDFFSDEVSAVEILSDEVKISGLRTERSPGKKGRVQLLEKPLELFGSQLQKPSSLNRPAAPRRGRGGLSAFAAKRNKVQKPSSGIGSRPRRKK